MFFSYFAISVTVTVNWSNTVCPPPAEWLIRLWKQHRTERIHNKSLTDHPLRGTPLAVCERNTALDVKPKSAMVNVCVYWPCLMLNGSVWIFHGRRVLRIVSTSGFAWRPCAQLSVNVPDLSFGWKFWHFAASHWPQNTPTVMYY